MDSAVATLSADLLDDYPAQDPRWAESIPDSQGMLHFALFFKLALPENSKKDIVVFKPGGQCSISGGSNSIFNAEKVKLLAIKLKALQLTQQLEYNPYNPSSQYFKSLDPLRFP